MIVMKFGGTSVATRARMEEVARLVAASQTRAPLVVTSAMGGVTNELLAIASLAKTGDTEGAEARITALLARHRAECGEDPPAALCARLDEARRVLTRLAQGVAMLRELTPRTLDAFAATGELLAAPMLAEVLTRSGVAAEYVDPRLLVRTDATFTSAIPHEEAIAAAVRERVLPLLQRGIIPVTGGFVGQEPGGETTTLGRGGSDYSAALLGAAEAESIEIWTDVDGILTADPRVVPGAWVIPAISYAEAAELAFFGAKVLHPATIRPAVQRGLPVWIKNTFRPGAEGTVVRAEVPGVGLRALACRRGSAAILISNPRMLLAHGFAARVFGVFEAHKVPVDVITTSEVSIAVTVDAGAPLDALTSSLSAFAEVRVLEGLGVLTAVGQRLRSTPGIAARIFGELSGINVVMISLGASDTNITLVLSESDLPAAMQRLHGAFFA